VADGLRKRLPAAAALLSRDGVAPELDEDLATAVDRAPALAPLAARCSACTIDRTARKGQDASDHAPVIAVFD